MRPGREYELLIEQMYKSLEPNAIIKHDDHIYDEKAKIKRQIDVSIRYSFAGTEHLIIVQVKDYKIKATVGVVEQFHRVILDVKANKGILICSKGFSKAAINKAEALGIECLSIYSALNKKWETLVKVNLLRKQHNFLLYEEIIVYFGDKSGQTVKIGKDMYSYDGHNIIGVMDIINDHILAKKTWEEVRKGQTMRVDFMDIKLLHLVDNKMVPASGGFVEIKYVNTNISRFYVNPTNYIYEVNHLENKDKLRELDISIDDIKSFVENPLANDKDVNGDPHISLEIFKFNEDSGHIFTYTPFVKGKITGNVFHKENRLMYADERGEKIVELENMLKNN